MSAAVAPSAPGKKLEKKPIKFSNLLLGSGLNMFEVSTLGQPFEDGDGRRAIPPR